ncbi:zinc-ribbon domain-containing protein [Methylobacterium haplocladii]|uniref:Thioredoxin n=1 Tax=Methylobacterium haplocladii TaxID=1176176 RepID=A0A512ILF1_9HYPH|nr:zinc-ribbon domain-containing protein [Methylobacterium haplocladii]GEO98529.1 thioredoxin [Methylobacterium haplocladii]GJD82834.1 hypothetical protein HPGCJGGD_0695 [Methylobacterium haplocladii]GLS61028.1 thioredoxin [Methylobacterium haplocladii]
MLIACPACASEYEIEGVLVGAEGRSVRCAACSETWFVGPESEQPDDAVDAWEAALHEEVPEETVAAPSPVIDQPVPPPRKAKAKPSPKTLAIPRLSPALAAGLAVFAILPLALLGRATVVRAMPRSAGLFSAVGLPVNLRGVAFRDVTAFRNPAEGANPTQLVVEGDLVGVARERVTVASLEVELRDAHGQSVYRWTVPPSRAALEPGETARFRASLSAPPPHGSQVLVRFTDADASEAKQAAKAAAPTEPEKPAPAADAGHGHH